MKYNSRRFNFLPGRRKAAMPGLARGITLLLVILVMASLMSISLGIFTLVVTEIRLSGEITASFNALFASDRGIEKLRYLDLTADAVCEPFNEGTNSYPPCPNAGGHYKSGMPDLPPAPPGFLLSNGACMTPYFTRAGNQVTITTVGQYPCGSELSVKRTLQTTYSKSTPSGVALPVAFWNFDWGAGESAITQNVEDISNDDRVAVEPNDGNRGANDSGEASDPDWINPNVGNCVVGGNCALKFNGLNTIVTVPDDDALDPPGQITISAWVRIPSPPTARGNIVSKGENQGYRFRINNNQTVRWFDRGATNSITGVAVVPLNAWTHIAVSGDASGLKIYINGIPDTSNTTPYEAPNTPSPLIIGAEPLFNEYFNGCIDNVKIWNNALSPSDVQIDFNSYTPGTSC